MQTEIGIDEEGESGQSADAEELGEREVRADLMFLAREFLTWLVFFAETEGGEFAGANEVGPFTISFASRVTLRTPAGIVTDMVMAGPAPVGSADLRYVLAGGMAVKEADLRLEQGEKVWTFGLSAECFDLKRVQLPALLDEESDDSSDERVALLVQLDEAIRVAFEHFLGLRTGPAWTSDVVPAIRAWLDAGT